MFSGKLESRFPQRVPALLSDGDNYRLLALPTPKKFERFPQDVRIKGARQSALSSQHQHQHAFLGSSRQ
jgi:hypothetical protein